MMKSKDIALSAISAAFAAIALTLGSFFEVVDVFMIAVATVAVMLPLYRKSYLGSFLCYLAGGLIAFLVSGMNIQRFIYPAYFLFAGAYPVVNALFKRLNLNKWIAYAIKLVWCFGAVYITYWLCAYVFGLTFDYYFDFIKKYIWLVLAAFTVVFFAMFDYVVNKMQLLIDKYLGRIVK